MRKTPKEQWIAIPGPDGRLSREIVDGVREMIWDNRPATSKGRRFFELAEIAHCGGYGNRMAYHASITKERMYPYYKCRRVLRDGKEACPCRQSCQNHRAEKLEQEVCDFVSSLMMNPEQLRTDLEKMIELESTELRGDPDQEIKAWLGKLAEADRMRSGYQDLAAKRLLSCEELREKLEQLSETRETAQQDLETLYDRQHRLEDFERNKEAVLDSYAKLAPEALNDLSVEERHRLYNMLRLEVVVNPDRSVEIHGALGTEFVQMETVPR